MSLPGQRTWSAILVLAFCAIPAQAERALLQSLVDAAYANYGAVTEGETAQYIPALAAANPESFGVVIATVEGEIIGAGNIDQAFAIMSAAKPFTLALLMEQIGPAQVVQKIGVEPTGLPFNALRGIDRDDVHPINPMINAGAITAVSLLQVDKPEQRWPLLLDYYGEFAGEPLQLMTDVYQSVSRSNYRNRALVNLLQLNGWLEADPVATLDVYNKQSSVAVTARQLAVMGASLANGGVNPVTGRRVLAADHVDEVLSVMLMSGFYDESGWWAYTTGLPSKSGVGGGVVSVVPGKMAIVGYSPRLSPAGNSVRGMRAVQDIAQKLDLSLFRPHPVRATKQ